MVVRDSTVVSARSLQTQLTPLLFFRGGAPPGAPGPCRGPGTSWDRGWRKDEPAPLDMFSKAAEEGLLGRGCRVLRVCLLGRLHAARQTDFQDFRCTLHPDLVRHQLELSVLPVVLRRARVQVHREAVCETEIQVRDPYIEDHSPGATELTLEASAAGQWEGPRVGHCNKCSYCVVPLRSEFSLPSMMKPPLSTSSPAP